MPELKKSAESSIKQSADLRDKSRNEQQKALLLREIVESNQQKKSTELRTSSERIIARSKELCNQAKKLKAARTTKGR